MKFKSLPQLLDYFKDEETCIKYYENARWGGNPVCPHCNSPKPYVTNRGYRCRECNKKFTVKIGTIYENSKLSFRIWFAAIYLITSQKKGINSVQLAIHLGITQKTAWFMLHRIREMMKNKAPSLLSGVVEVDETYIGGLERYRHMGKKLANKETGLANDGTVYNEKKTVMGMIERGGNLILKLIPDRKFIHITTAVKEMVLEGSTLMSDEAPVYTYLNRRYQHKSVNHCRGNYVDGDTYTNTIEGVFSGLKRCLGGNYHTVSKKHLQRYLNEYAARYNNRKVNPYIAFENYVSNSEGGLLYKNLTAKK